MIGVGWQRALLIVALWLAVALAIAARMSREPARITHPELYCDFGDGERDLCEFKLREASSRNRA